MSKTIINLFVLFLICLVGLSSTSFANGIDSQVLISAQSISHNTNSGIVIATGDVEVTAGQRTLLADHIIYDPETDNVKAIGNISLLEPNGDVLFADDLELTNQLRNGFISGIRVLLADKSRLAGLSADRVDGVRTELLNAVFTSCNTCAGDPNPPVWQVKATVVIHNQQARRIDYKDARLEFFGIPVLYTPFFSHPDPSVIRQSGFLAPSYATSSHLGFQLEIPYYFDLAPHRDATFSPIVTSREGLVLKGEYRERTKSGLVLTEASFTNPKKREGALQVGGRDLRGHVRAKGRFEISPIWNWGFDAARSTDDTYLRRYGLSNENTLVTNTFLEGFSDRNYAMINAWAFQGLRKDDDPGQTPLVLPMIEYSLTTDPGDKGESITFDASALALTRNEGADSWRFSTAGTWRIPYSNPQGHIYNFTASLRGDAYVVSGVINPNNPNGSTENGFIGRVLPRIGMNWRYPLIRAGESTNYVVEPIISLIAAPRGGNPGKIPNEDSLSFEFDDTNLFSSSRFPGLDRWEGGPRLNYGVRLGAYGKKSFATAMIGQTLRNRDHAIFDNRSGLGTGPSDYVGRLHLSAQNVSLTQRFRIDQESFSFRRNEISLEMGPEVLKLSAGYVFLSEELSTENLGRREELIFSGNAPLGDSWKLTALSRHDLSDDGGLLLARFGLIYICDCMQFSINFTRQLTSDRDVPRSTTIALRLRLRHLG